MKTKTILAAALCAVALVGCGKKGADKFGEVKLENNATAADSIGYFIGEQLAYQRSQLATMDTLFKSTEMLSKFDEGFYAGLEAMTGSDKAFNEGFIRGANVAMQLMTQGEQMGEEFNIDAVASGFTKSFDKEGKPVQDLEKRVNDNQYKLMIMMQQMQARAVKKKTEEALKKTEVAKKGLDDAAKKGGYAKVNGIYMKTETAGNGVKLKKGDNITATMALSDTSGKDIFPGYPVHQTVGSSQSVPPAVDAVLDSLEMNGKYVIIGSIDQLLSSDMVSQAVLSGQIDPEQLYVITYEVVPDEASAAK